MWTFSHKRLTQQKKQRDRERKELEALGRRHLANVRVVQRNVVYIVGIGPRFAKEEVGRSLIQLAAHNQNPFSLSLLCVRVTTLVNMARYPRSCWSSVPHQVVVLPFLAFISPTTAARMLLGVSQRLMVPLPQGEVAKSCERVMERQNTAWGSSAELAARITLA